jgi:hypothetical protein
LVCACMLKVWLVSALINTIFAPVLRFIVYANYKIIM